MCPSPERDIDGEYLLLEFAIDGIFFQKEGPCLGASLALFLVVPVFVVFFGGRGTRFVAI